MPFRTVLSKEDQQVFDRLFDRAKFHIHAGVYLARSWPMETILVPICLEHGKMIEEILLFVLAACRSDGAAAKMIKPPDEGPGMDTHQALQTP